ncbi:LppX_LprAFG lipoprotein [Streptomyces uncialis]|uniref:LppX_LprAFG lipoprotein n=1 Tax=Streptomyces uncialis TaxID=1048205 RepID=UPI002E31F30A|nr:LppX_LprAFG lipoprotein [Streptomyces uncialis]
MHRPLSLVAAALLCAGCSAVDTPTAKNADEPGVTAVSPAPHSAVRAAVTTTGRSSARIDQKIVMANGEKEYTLTVTGGFDFAADQGRIAAAMPGGPFGRSEVTFAGGNAYISGAKGLDDGVWGAMPRAKAEAHYLLRAPLNDPEHILKQVSALRNVSHEGEATVHGVRAAHYRGTLDHEAFTLRMARDVRKAADQIREKLGDDLPVFADVWVDDRGRLVRTRMAVGTGPVDMTVTMTLTDFGKPVRVTVPKAGNTLPVAAGTGILLG